MKLIIDGLAIEYSDEGVGPVILMLHGWKDSLSTFNQLVKATSVKNRIIRVDLPGFGRSESPHGVWNLDDYVLFVNNFCEKLNVTPYAIVGHSFGGRIAIKGIASGILTPNKLVLIASAGVAKRRTFRNKVFVIVAKFGKMITYVPPLYFWRDQLRRKLYQSIGSDYFEVGSLKKTFLNIINEDLSLGAQKIYIPTLLIWGDKDNSTLPEEGVQLSKFIKNSKLEMIPSASHFVHQEYPEQVAKFISNHL